MSFIEIPGLNDAKELPVAPEGKHDLVVTDAQMHEKEGKHSIRTIIEIEGPTKYKNILHFIGLPNQNDEDDTKEMKALMARRFFNQFGVPLGDNGVELEQMIGCRSAGANVVQEEYQNEMNNKIVLNKLPIEG